LARWTPFCLHRRWRAGPPALMAKAHTIVLVQYNRQLESRSYLDFEDLSPALDGALI
jgi:hypothetical protein